MEDDKYYVQCNRKAWNLAMEYHRKAKNADWDSLFDNPYGVFQKEPELSALHRIGLMGKDIVHLCCNNGVELLSLKRMGAGRCVGFDICDEAIADGKRRAEKYCIPVEFYQSNVYEISTLYDNSFDLVYITIGALTWLPDLPGFFAVASRLLRSGGKVFIYEQHPFASVLPWDISLYDQKPMISESYFQDHALRYEESLDYYGGVEYNGPVTYEFAHTLSEIIGALLTNQLSISGFWEYDHDISNGLAWVKKTGLRLPLSYILISVKQ